MIFSRLGSITSPLVCLRAVFLVVLVCVSIDSAKPFNMFMIFKMARTRNLSMRWIETPTQACSLMNSLTTV